MTGEATLVETKDKNMAWKQSIISAEAGRFTKMTLDLWVALYNASGISMLIRHPFAERSTGDISLKLTGRGKQPLLMLITAYGRKMIACGTGD
jgi:hypothetical protein